MPNHINVEIKARCHDPERIHEILELQQAQYMGVDHQIDTYFAQTDGRLKLRKGKIEKALIYYQRENESGPKISSVFLYEPKKLKQLRNLLSAALGVKVVVDKKRAIYYIENVKFHVDAVEGLGSFVEIEAIDKEGSIGEDKLREQCQYYMSLFGIRPEDLIQHSYSDLLLQQQEQPSDGGHDV